MGYALEHSGELAGVAGAACQQGSESAGKRGTAGPKGRRYRTIGVLVDTGAGSGSLARLCLAEHEGEDDEDDGSPG